MAAMGGMGVPMGPAMGPEMVDPGGMGAPPVAPADPNEMMLQALMSVLGKWDNNESQIAGEKSALMQTLMMIASASPPDAAEAALMGEDPNGYGMTPQ